MNLTEIIQSAKDHILESGEYIPTLFVELSNEENCIAVFPDFPRTTIQKQMFLFLSGRKIGKEYLGKEVKQICLITEAWLSVRNHPDEFDCAPSEDPNRKEVLIAHTLEINDRNLSQKLQIIEMLRDGQGNLVNLLPYSNIEDAKSRLLLSFLAGFASAEMSEGDMLNLMLKHQGGAN